MAWQEISTLVVHKDGKYSWLLMVVKEKVLHFLDIPGGAADVHGMPKKWVEGTADVRQGQEKEYCYLEELISRHKDIVSPF